MGDATSVPLGLSPLELGSPGERVWFDQERSSEVHREESDSGGDCNDKTGSRLVSIFDSHCNRDSRLLVILSTGKWFGDEIRSAPIFTK